MQPPATSYLTLGGGALNFVRLDPIKALYWSAVLNGFIAVHPRIMRRYTLPRSMVGGGWLATLAMTAASIGLFMF